MRVYLIKIDYNDFLNYHIKFILTNFTFIYIKH